MSVQTGVQMSVWMSVQTGVQMGVQTGVQTSACGAFPSSDIPLMPLVAVHPPCTCRSLTGRKRELYLDISSRSKPFAREAGRSANHTHERCTDRENSMTIRTKTGLIEGYAKPQPICIDLESASSKLHYMTESQVASASCVVNIKMCKCLVRLHGTESTQAGRKSTCAPHAVIYRLPYVAVSSVV